MPTGFNITAIYPRISDITLTFVWDLPQGSGPGAIVDYYEISILPNTSNSNPVCNTSSTACNVTLEFNVVYNATITAVNCVGRSNSSFKTFHIEIGKSIIIT